MEPAERARVCTRLVGYETLVQLVSRGGACGTLVYKLCKELLRQFRTGEVQAACANHFIEACVEEISSVAEGVMVVLRGEGRTEKFQSLITAKIGVSHVVAASLHQQAVFHQMISERTQHQAASVTLGPKLVEAMAVLGGDPTYEELDKMLESLAGWRDALAPGAYSHCLLSESSCWLEAHYRP